MAGHWQWSDPGRSAAGSEPLGSLWIGQLECPNCLTETPHEVRYVAGILHRLDCLVCGQRWDVGHDRLRDSYLRALPRRIFTKPGRLAREARHDPVAFAVSFPMRFLSKPARVAEEAGTVAGMLDG